MADGFFLACASSVFPRALVAEYATVTPLVTYGGDEVLPAAVSLLGSLGCVAWSSPLRWMASSAQRHRNSGPLKKPHLRGAVVLLV